MNRYIKVGVVILICLFSGVSLSSCFDDKEMNELAYVIALGIDKADGGGYNYTFQISNPIASGGGEEKPSKEMSGEDDMSENSEENKEWDKTKIDNNKNSGVMEIVVKSNDYAEAVSLVNNIISKRINLAHLKIIVFSEEVCQDGIGNHAEFLMSEREIRPGTNVIVAKKSAEYFLKNVNPKLDMSTAKYYELLINNENMTYSIAIELRELYGKGFDGNRIDGILPLGDVSDKKKSVEFSAANVQTDEKSQDQSNRMISGNINSLSGEKTELFGAAVINDMKMVGVIDGEEVKYFKLIRGELKDNTVFSNEGKSIVVKNYKKSCIRANTSSMVPKITINVFAEVENVENVAELKQKLQDNIYMLLIKTAREYGADIFGFSNYAKKNYLTWREFEQYGWNEKYHDSIFSVNVNIKNTEMSTARYIFE